MKRNLKKVFTIVLAMCMFSTTVFASELKDNNSTKAAKTPDKNQVISTNGFTISGEDLEKLGQGMLKYLMEYFGEEKEEAPQPVAGNTSDELEGYALEQVVILSRHNLRAPLSSNGSVPQELTPHEWIKWSAGSSELTVKGGIQETNMGQYFRKWFDKEGLFPENSIPEPGEVRFCARDKQRCRATAKYFASGLFPLADIDIEHPGDADNTPDFMKPVLHFYSDEYAEDATEQVANMNGDGGFEGLSKQLRDDIALVMDVVDMEDSEAYKSGKYGDLMKDSSGFQMAPFQEGVPHPELQNVTYGCQG